MYCKYNIKGSRQVVTEITSKNGDLWILSH